MGAGRRAIFLDRDGTVLDELGYLGDPDALRLLPGAAEAIRELNAAGFVCVLVTNQSGVARGLFDEAQLARVHARLRVVLAEEGAHLDAIYHCPHHPDLGEPPFRAACACRKPEPGMFLDAARDLGLDLAHSVAIGDAARDAQAARAAGVGEVVLVLTGKGEATRAALAPEELERLTVRKDLAEAARALVAQLR